MKGKERERRKRNGRKEGDERKRGDGDRGEMLQKEGQKELSQVRRGLVLCLFLILSHQTVAYGCLWCTRALLLAISEQSSLIYTPSDTCALPYTTLNAHPHAHPPHSTHTQIHLHPSTPHGSPIHRLLPRFSLMGTSLHCQPAACLNIHTL